MEFEEKQFLGYNKSSLFVRLVIASGSLLSYFFSDSKEKTGDLFLLIGIAILLLSVLSFFVLHFKTQLKGDELILDGFWTTRRVKINLKTIKNVEVVKYSKILFNRPVYNLHIRGTVKFFTHGNWAVQLTDETGQKYRIGSQRFTELSEKIKEKLVY